MAERKSYKWRKLGRDLLTDERTLRLSQLALHLRLVLEIMGDADEDQLVAGAAAPGVGWLIDEYGDAYDIERLAALVRADEAAVEVALRELERARIVVRSDTGAVGTVDHEERQLDPTTKRTRAWRSRQPAAEDAEHAGNGAGTQAEQPGNDQRAESREQRAEVPPTDPPAQAPACEIRATVGTEIRLTRERLAWRPALVSERAGIPRGTLTSLEQGHIQPTRDELDKLAEVLGNPDLRKFPAVDDDGNWAIPQQVVGELYRLRLELGLADGPAPEVDAATVRTVFAPAAADRAAGRDPLATWLTVLRRAAEEIRRERARGKATRSAEYFRLDDKGGLGGEARRRKYLETVDLDRRDDGPTPAARGSPRRGRPEPPQNAEVLEPEIREA